MDCQWKSAATCLKIFKAIQHTNPIVNLDFTSNGIHIMSMDTSKTSLVKLILTKDYFESYQCRDTMILGIYTETLCNVLQKIKKEQLSWSATGNALTIICQSADQKTEFSLRAIDIEEDTLDIPELQDDVALTMLPSTIKDITDKLLMGKTDVHINVNQQNIELTSESTEFGKITHTEPIAGKRMGLHVFRKEVAIALSFHAMKSMFIFSTCGENECFLGFSNQMPSRLKVGLGEQSSLCLYVAPKIIDDD
jgi:proliferating cell nuclear antigen PCNA